MILYLLISVLIFIYISSQRPEMFPFIKSDLLFMLYLSLSLYSVNITNLLLDLLIFLPVACLIIKIIIFSKMPTFFIGAFNKSINYSWVEKYLYIYILINGFDELLSALAKYSPVSSAVSLIAVSNND